MNEHGLISEWLEGQGYPLLKKATITNSFEPAVQIHDLIFVSSATPRRPDGTEICGKVGTEISLETAKEAACFCVVHSLSLLRDVIGESLDDRIVRAVDLTFFINATSTFCCHSDVADAGSDLLIGSLGTNGVHARSAIGAGSLVRNVSVVLKAVYQVRE